MLHKDLLPPSCDDKAIWDALMANYQIIMLSIGDEYGLFALLNEDPLSALEVANKLSLGPRATEVLLGSLASLGFLTQYNQKFYISEVSRNFLLPTSPFYWGGVLSLVRQSPTTCSVVKSAFNKEKQATQQYNTEPDLWEFNEANIEQATLFTKAMHALSFAAARTMAQRGDFSNIKKLLDVGGGSGSCSIALALHYPELCCSIMELPAISPLSKEYISQYNLQDRINTIAANMFRDEWPKGYDAILFSNIFHDWNEQQCLFLAQQSFNSLPSGGRIYLHEMLLSDTKDHPLATISFSISMLINTDGKQYTSQEISNILLKAGFNDITITNSYSYYSIISATKP